MLYSTCPVKVNIKTNIMQCVAAQAALACVRMVRRQHATIELQRFFTHRKRIRVPSKDSVRKTKVVHGRACTPNHKSPITPQSINNIITYVRMVRRQLAKK
jgi:hypothetical protein